MGSLSTVPDTVNLSGYAGDDLVIRISVDDSSFTEACTWSGEIRKSRAEGVDTTWNIVPDSSGGGATATLTGDQTRALCASVPLLATRAGAPPPPAVKYSGVFDIQVVRDSDGFTRTLFQGTLTIELDVTQT
jgi:hypothetical protein